MNLIDMHCDTIYEMYNKDGNLLNGDFSVNIEKMILGGYTGQFFATFFDFKESKSPFETANLMIDAFLKELDKNKDYISLAVNYEDIIKNKEKSKLSAILTIEEGGALEGSLSNIKHFYEKGVRLIGITWNYENSLAYPHCFRQDIGLKHFGKEAVEYMHDTGIIVDVSHLSDSGFEDVYNISKLYNKPFIASHSNAREITYHSRNLTDNMIRKIAESGGIIGLNFASSFLGESEIARVEDMVTHLKHIKNKGGIECLAIGSDFDGIENQVEIEDASKMIELEDILRKNKFTQDEIEKIMFKNSLRVIKDILK